MRFPDEKIPLGEEWYYDIDGRIHGPLLWNDLQELLGCSGETAAHVHVRKGATGEWTAFRSGSMAARPPGLSGAEVEKSDQAPAQRPSLRTQAVGRTSPFQRNWYLFTIAGIWILLNVLVALFWPEPYARERLCLATLKQIVAKADQLRAKGGSDKEWHALRSEVNQSLTPMISYLKKSASSSELARQQLLWCAKDLAPRIMGPRNTERDEQERRLKQYLESVEEALGRH